MKFFYILLFSCNLFALECNESNFNKIDEYTINIFQSYNNTTISPKEQASFSSPRVTKANYKNDILLLNSNYTKLKDISSKLDKASEFIDYLIKGWRLLEKSCSGEKKKISKLAKSDCLKLKIAIKERQKETNKYLSMTELVINSSSRYNQSMK